MLETNIKIASVQKNKCYHKKRIGGAFFCLQKTAFATK
jgi:hypothetical protein